MAMRANHLAEFLANITPHQKQTFDEMCSEMNLRLTDAERLISVNGASDSFPVVLEYAIRENNVEDDERVDILDAIRNTLPSWYDSYYHISSTKIRLEIEPSVKNVAKNDK